MSHLSNHTHPTPPPPWGEGGRDRKRLFKETLVSLLTATRQLKQWLLRNWKFLEVSWWKETVEALATAKTCQAGGKDLILSEDLQGDTGADMMMMVQTTIRCAFLLSPT